MFLRYLKNVLSRQDSSKTKVRCLEDVLRRLGKFCIIFNMISFFNTQGPVKIRLACSKALLLTITSSNIMTHSNGYIKGDKYFFFTKIGAANILLKLSYF